jgi:hypothetical protein
MQGRRRTVSPTTPAIEDTTTAAFEDEARFVRGVLFGVVFSLPIWGALIAAAKLLL